MASVAHIAVGLAAGRYHGNLAAPPVSAPLLMAGYVALSLLPDADVVAFTLGIPYEAPFGHRGASHSLAVALVLGACAAAVARLFGGRPWRVFLLVGAVVASHGLLDTLTDGGRGVALLWPLSDARYFAPWRPIPVAPIGLDFVSARGLEVAVKELVVSLPVLLYALVWRRSGARAGAGRGFGHRSR